MANTAPQDGPQHLPKQHFPDVQPLETSSISQENTNASSQPPQELPSLSPSDFNTYNRLAVHMDALHQNFRQFWTVLYNSCVSSRRPSGMSLRQFVTLGLDFCHHLHAHHSIEEEYVFPILATRMPQFRKKDHLLEQHKQIHVGLDKFEEYLEKCRKGETELRMEEITEIMERFGTVFWEHLDEEVRELGADNMRKYWSKEEIRRLYP